MAEAAEKISFPNHPHDVPPGSLALARAFLAHYDAMNRGDLGRGGALGDRAIPEMPFVGDDPDGTYWPAGSAEARSIPPEDRVPLPGRLVAEVWGKEGVVWRTETAPVGGWRRRPRLWLSFAGLTVSAFASSVFDWHVLFDFAEKGGLGPLNFALSWTLFAAFLVMGAVLAGGSAFSLGRKVS